MSTKQGQRTHKEQLPLVDLVSPIALRASAEADNGQPLRFDVVYSTGAGVLRYDWARDRRYIETLEISDAAIDATRLKAGAPFLDSHWSMSTSDVLGVAEAHRIEDGRAVCTVEVSQRDQVAGVRQDIKNRILRNVSVGYVRTRIEMIPPVADGALWEYRVTGWTPHEVSVVPIPADPGAQIRSASGDWQDAQGRTLKTFECEIVELASRNDPLSHQPTAGTAEQTGVTMTQAQAAANVQRTQAAGAPATPEDNVAAVRAAAAAEAAEIVRLCARHGMQEQAAGYIAQGKTLDQVRATVLDSLADADRSAGGHGNVRGIQTVTDEAEVRGQGIVDAISHRLMPASKLSDNGRRFRALSLVEIGREMLTAAGYQVREMHPVQIANAMLAHRANNFTGSHTVADFPGILANVANKRLRNSYESAPRSYTAWARRAPNAPDFKTIQVSALGAAPDLLKVNEFGEFTYGTVGEKSESYQAVTYGRILSFTRQAIVNDDLRAFDRMATAFGSSAARLENRLAYSILTANANMADGNALFSTQHANLAASGAGSALQKSSLKTARAAMRVQKGLAGEELNLTPSVLVVPSALEMDAFELTSANFVPATQSAISEFREGGRASLRVVADAVLDGASATAWYLMSDSDQIDTVEYCYVDGMEGPQIAQEWGFEQDGMGLKCSLDFAIKAIDWLGMYRSPGA